MGKVKKLRKKKGYSAKNREKKDPFGKLMYIACQFAVWILGAAFVLGYYFIKEGVLFADGDIFAYEDSLWSTVMMVITIVLCGMAMVALIIYEDDIIDFFAGKKKTAYTYTGRYARENEKRSRIRIVTIAVSASVFIAVTFTACMSHTLLTKKGEIVRCGVFSSERRVAENSDIEGIELSVERKSRKSGRYSHTWYYSLTVNLITDTGKSYAFDAGGFRDIFSMLLYLDTFGEGKISVSGDIEKYIYDKGISGAEAEGLRKYWR
jgi:hypothetical protein